MGTNEISPIIQYPATPVLQGKGYFTLGSSAVFFFDFPDINGDRYDPIGLQATFRDPSGQVFATLDEHGFDKLELGKYALIWLIPTTDPHSVPTETGAFTVTLNFTAETIDGPLSLQTVDTFMVGDAGAMIIHPRMIGVRSAMESFLGYAQRIPVFHEIGRLNHARNIAEFSFPRWNQPRTKVYVNGDVLESGYYVNYIDGKIQLDHALSSTDELFASYTFRWFEDEELYAFITQAIEIFNQFPPHSTYNVINIENRYAITVVEQATVFALRRLMMDILFQEPAKVFGGMDRADKILSSLDTLKRNFEDDLKLLYEQKKYGPYTGLTMTITVPEYTLPGGRSRWFRYLFKGG